VQPGCNRRAGAPLDQPVRKRLVHRAVGVEAVAPGATRPRKLLIGNQAIGWATFDALADPGTPGRR